MKKISKILFLFLAVSLFTVAESKAQIAVGIHVGVRPMRPRGAVIVRGRRPSPRHVWVSEEWVPSGNTYVYQQAHWALPPRYGQRWVPGHWAHDSHGDIWMPGRWD